MLRLPNYLPLAAAALTALSGCTIYTYRNPPPSPAKAQPAKPAKPTTPPRTTTGPKIMPRDLPTVVNPGITRTLPERAPRITSPILFGNGTGGRFRGEAFVIPTSSKTLPDLDGLVPFATLFTDRFDIASQEFSGGFPGALKQDEWFAIRYEGALVIESAGLIGFELTSDDGSILYLDGKKIIENDGLHVATAKTVTVDVAAGPHRLRLDYFQGNKGPVALQLVADDRGGKILDNPIRPR
jgi:hypothetical protein